MEVVTGVGPNLRVLLEGDCIVSTWVWVLAPAVLTFPIWMSFLAGLALVD